MQEKHTSITLINRGAAERSGHHGDVPREFLSKIPTQWENKGVKAKFSPSCKNRKEETDMKTIVLEPWQDLTDDGYSGGLSQETLQSLTCVMGEINARTERTGFKREACLRATFSG